MLHRFDPLLSRAYGMPEGRVMLVNVALAAFVALSHGGALMVAASRGLPELEEIRSLAIVSLPVCAVVLASAVVALFHRVWARRVLPCTG